MEDIEEVIADPLGDDDIKRFLPNSKIVKYSELAKFKKLEDLVTTPQDFCFILYEDSPNQGHWVCLSRPDDKSVEFFDSYGGSPDSQQKWVPADVNKKLGQGRPYLSLLLDRCPFDVVYNPVKYQKDGSDINSCGRHCVTRIGCMLDGMDLRTYYKFLKKIKKDKGHSFDEIVSTLAQ